MDTLQPESSSPNEFPPKQERKEESSRGKTGVLLVLMMLSGLVGGLLSPLALRLYNEYLLPKSLQTETNLEKAKVSVVAEDNLVADLVAKTTPAVVSIVISKDVPQVRNFYNSPFGGRFPFFDPFGGGEELQPQGTTEKQKIGSGSGFFVSAEGLIVTNKHVVSDQGAEYTVITTDGTEYTASVLGRDPANDIAILKVEGKDFPVLALGDSDKIRVGETAIAIGNPLGEFSNSVSRGIISGVKRNLDASSRFGDAERLLDIIQTDAAINPGNSGGPLFNLSGEVVGVSVAMAVGAENIAFALPINRVKYVIEQVRSTGKITTPYIGVRHVLVTEEIQKQNNLPFDYGALVLRGQNITDLAVVPGSPADKAGITENDIILEVNGTKVDTDHPLLYRITAYVVGDEITLKVWHKGEIKDIKLSLEERK